MSTTIDGFEVDVIVSIVPSRGSTVTQFPVEKGADTNDHIITGPPIIAVEGLVSDTPLAAVSRTEHTKPSSDAYALLTEIQSSKRLVDIISPLFPPFKDVAITSLSAPKNADTGDALRFTATFQSLNIVDVSSESETTLVELPRHRKRVRKGAKPAVKKDASEVKTPVASTAEKSWLTQIKEAL